MRVFTRNNTVKVDEENPYWMSFSDLMSGVLIIFILASVALIIQLTESQIQFEQEMQQKREELQKQRDNVEEQKRKAEIERKKAEKLQQEVAALKEELYLAKLKVENDIDQLRDAEAARRAILYEVKERLAKLNIVVEVVDNDSVLRIPETTLTFASNSYDIPDEIDLRLAIKNIGNALHEAILKPFDLSKNTQKRFEYLDTVFIEGHTDSRPTSRVKGNWGLSSFRAISLWEFWEDNSQTKPPFSELQNAFGQKLFSVSGYAASRRLQLVEETPEERRINRRIDIRFTVKRPSITQLEDIVKP